MSATLYLATEKNVKVRREHVVLEDIADVSCADPRILARAKVLNVMQIPKEQYGRYVVTAIALTKLIQKNMDHVEITHIGEPEFVVTYENPILKSPIRSWIKTLFVCVVTFFGSSFSIMTFNTDVDVPKLFGEIYRQFMGAEGMGYSVLEISYSIGIGIGVVFFFNHFGSKKLTSDPTPMEVEMRAYEDQVNTTLLAQESRRKGKE